MTHASMALAPPPSIAERRCFPRFDVALAGLCSINLGTDAACISVDLSIAGIALRTEAAAAVGDAVIASFREFGMARGRIVRTFEGGFALALNTVDPYRSRLSHYLAWVVRGLEQQDAGRAEERLVPLNRIATLTRADGRTSIGRVENVSRSGLLFSSTAPFDLDETIRVGRHAARVVRVFADGVAADFESALPDDAFDVMISFARAG